MIPLLSLLFTAGFAAGVAAHVAVSTVADPPRVTVQQTGTNALLFAVHAVSDRVVWASGTGGTVLRTVNGGTTWTPRPMPGGDSLQFRDIHAFGPDTAFVLAIGNGEASRIYRTVDGGASWTEPFRNSDPDAFFDCFTFMDARHGIVFGDARTVFMATGGPGSRLFISTDGGASFSVRETPFVRSASSGTSGLAFRSAQLGIGVAGDMTNLRGDSAAAVVAVTRDGGATLGTITETGHAGVDAFGRTAWVGGRGVITRLDW